CGPSAGCATTVGFDCRILHCRRIEETSDAPLDRGPTQISRARVASPTHDVSRSSDLRCDEKPFMRAGNFAPLRRQQRQLHSAMLRRRAARIEGYPLTRTAVMRPV